MEMMAISSLYHASTFCFSQSFLPITHQVHSWFFSKIYFQILIKPILCFFCWLFQEFEEAFDCMWHACGPEQEQHVVFCVDFMSKEGLKYIIYQYSHDFG